MPTKDARGTKRTCQSNECGLRFYDLNRNPISCPNCGTIYEIAHAPAGAVIEAIEPTRPKAKRAEYEPVAEEAVPAEAEELASIETDEDLGEEAADETFLEDEEEGGNVGEIIGGPVGEGEEDEV
ncbi:MAG: TIGR02300 family protein [Hyphomicrobiaceae bacterium]|nr:TIGR02300 family protein [Hyphomicrobiaceae bacterium]